MLHTTAGARPGSWARRSVAAAALCLAAALAGVFCVSPLRADPPTGSLYGWGTDEDGQLGRGWAWWPQQVAGPGRLLTDMTAVAAGDYHTAAVKSDGTVWAWGYNGDGQLGDGTSTDRLLPVQVKGSGGVGFLTGVTAVAAGSGGDGGHTVALKTDGTVWAWGCGGYGQLGDGTGSDSLTPLQVKGPGGVGYLMDVAAVAAGDGYTVARKTDGTVWAWGRNNLGQLGDNTTTDRLSPVQVKGAGGAGFLTGVAAVDAGRLHTVALRTDGTVWSWGWNLAGQFGDGTTTNSLTPVQAKGPGGVGFLTDVAAVAAGGAHLAAVKTDGSVWACGRNWNGGLGDGTTTDRRTPVQVLGPGGAGFLTGVAAVAAGDLHTVARKSDGSVWAWGYNNDGELGDGTWDQRPTPVQVKGPEGAGFLTGVAAVAAGGYDTVALKTDNTVWAWGRNNRGQLGLGCVEGESTTPTRVKGGGGLGFLTDVKDVEAGQGFTVAVKSDGTVWAWGYDGDGQLGDGTATDSWTPVQVKGPGGVGFLTGVAAVATGGGYAVALKTDGTVWCWGANGDGQLGDGTTNGSLTPVQVKGPGGVGFLSGVAAVEAGSGSDGNHTLALKTDGTVWAWGRNDCGQLGDGTGFSRSTPVQVKGPGGTGFLSGVVAVAAGCAHSIALKGDGTVWGWGMNEFGQVGDGTWGSDRYTPVQVKGPGGAGSLTGVAAVAVGGGPWNSDSGYTVAVKTDGTVWAWGSNGYGELGDGTQGDDRVTPVQVVGPGGSGFLTGVATVAAGCKHTVALKTDGTAWSWGRNWYGGLGNGTYDDSLTPVQVVGPDGTGVLTGAVAVSAGDEHTMAIVSAGPAAITVSAALDWDWVYQNAPTRTQGRHKCVLTIAVTNDPNGNTTYTANVTRNAASTGQVVIESTADPLVWNIKGGQYGVDPFGAVTLDVSVTGNEHGGTGTTTANLTVRKLGDIDGSGAVGLQDKVQLNKRLNGLATPGYDLRHFDLNGGGTVGLDDKLILNMILNGLPVP